MIGRRRGVSLLFAAIIGCAACGSEVKRCRAAAAFETNPIARELALDRCEHAADRTRAEQAEARRRQDENMERSQAALRSARSAEATIRRNPRALELGATPKESGQLCRQQGGVHSRRALVSHAAAFDVYECKIGGVRIFAGVAPEEGAQLVRVTIYYKGRALDEARQSLTELMRGPPAVSVEHGVRVFTWRNDSSVIRLEQYDAGVVVTGANRSESEK